MTEYNVYVMICDNCDQVVESSDESIVKVEQETFECLSCGTCCICLQNKKDMDFCDYCYVEESCCD